MELTRNELIAKLEKTYPNMFLRTTEDFNGASGGIWTSGEESPEDKSELPIFSYYAESSSYEFGVRTTFAKYLENLGWYAEFYDAGTVMLWLN